MKIEIQDAQTISAIQDVFNATFPYLRIAFFLPMPSGTHYQSHHFEQKTLSNFRKQSDRSALQISSDMTVSELEKHITSGYTIGVRLFRKSGKSWLETIFTEDWTLEKQNTEGELLSKNRETRGI